MEKQVRSSLLCLGGRKKKKVEQVRPSLLCLGGRKERRLLSEGRASQTFSPLPWRQEKKRRLSKSDLLSSALEAGKKRRLSKSDLLSSALEAGKKEG